MLIRWREGRNKSRELIGHLSNHLHAFLDRHLKLLNIHWPGKIKVGASKTCLFFYQGICLGQQGAGGVGGLLSISNPGSAQFACYDGNGNITALIDTTSTAITALYEYGPFGEVIRATGPLAKANPFRFSTKYQDNESDIVIYPYRAYNPFTGRWLSRDPAEEAEGGMNLYGFVGNNPVSQMDDLGLAFYAIDGTSADASMHTNPRLLYLATAERPRQYWRGPYDGPGGHDSYFLALSVRKQICEDYCQRNGNMTINLTGWSRGAVVAAEVAQLLNAGGATADVAH